MDYYIKASDEQSLWSALEAAGLAKKEFDPADPLNQAPEDAEGWQPTGAFEWRKTDGYDLDIIGVIFKPTGETGEDANGEYQIVEPLEGYHANLRMWGGELSDEQKAALPLIEKPNTPTRVWAGD